MEHRSEVETSTRVPAVTVVGTGAIGNAVVKRLLSEGVSVMVWNRTAGRTTDLVGAGAVAAPSLQDAVTATGLTLMALKDYGAVEDALDQLAGDLSGRTIVVLCTGSPADAERAAARAGRLGAHYIDGGVQTAPEDIGTERATILYSGSTVGFEQHRPVLQLLSAPTFMGASPQAAATWDLALFGVWYDAQLGVLRALQTVDAAGIELEPFAETAATQLGRVVDAVPTTVGELRSGEFPKGPADLEEHRDVVEKLRQLRARSPIGDGGLGDVDRVLASLIATGRADEGLSAVVGDHAV